MTAVAAGRVRVGRAMGGTPPGVHDIGTWGQVGVAAGVARLLAPGDAAAAGRAIQLAASAVLLSDATTIFRGRTGGHAFLGASVQLGAALASAAVAGLEPEPGALDRHFAAVAARDWDPTALEASDRHEVLGGYVKVHPTCAHLHGVNDAVADLLPLDGADVAEVEVRAFAAAAGFEAVADDELQARFSVPTSVAVALVTGRLDETTMTAQTVASPAVQDLARRVRVVHDPALDAGYPDGRPARVTVVLRDGTVRTAAGDRPRGDADRALDRAQMRAKAVRLLTGRFGDAGHDVIAAVYALAHGGTPRELGERLRTAAAGVSS
jgi:2-methylcitrate dehydratase PrpD